MTSPDSLLNLMCSKEYTAVPEKTKKNPIISTKVVIKLDRINNLVDQPATSLALFLYVYNSASYRVKI